jgi:hypothetical protein
MGLRRRQFNACMMAGLAGRLLALPPRPKLMVMVLSVGFRPDYIDSAWSQFGTGGFHELLGNGAYFPDCRHLASTFSSSAVATLATGAWPGQHGIVADSWYDRQSHAVVPASAKSLLATTLAAQVASESRTRVFVVSMNAAHAGLFAGTPDARLFWMDEQGRFATAGETRDWMSQFNLERPPEAASGARWMAQGAKPEAPPLRTLPLDVTRPRDFIALYRSSPFGQRALFDFAAELIMRERIGQGDTFDFLCVMDGSMEQLGYETGARSPLMRQMTLQLDRRLESLLALLNHSIGEGAFDLVFAGAHGAPDAPAPEARARMAVKGETLAQAIEHGLAASGAKVEKYVYPFLYLDAGAGRDAEPVRLLAAQAALEQPAVAGYLTSAGACSALDEWARRFRDSFHPHRSGDVMLSYQPGYVEDYGQNRGVSYGSLYNYDVRVPLCFYGPQFRTGIFEAPVESVDVAPTLARAMGIAPPSTSMGRVLSEAFAQ